MSILKLGTGEATGSAFWLKTFLYFILKGETSRYHIPALAVRASLLLNSLFLWDSSIWTLIWTYKSMKSSLSQDITVQAWLWWEFEFCRVAQSHKVKNAYLGAVSQQLPTGNAALPGNRTQGPHLAMDPPAL